MPAVVWVVGAIVVLVVAPLAVDWFTAGRLKSRLLIRAKDQNSDNADVGHAQIESQGHRDQYERGSGL